jgi:cation diffusion facilitator CzcD-associated flavoprotein CzcO
VLPRNDAIIPERTRRLFARLPLAQKLVRAGIYTLRELMLLAFREGRLTDLNEKMARRYLAKTIHDPALRAKLTPGYRIGCKRILISDDYLPSLNAPNIEVVTERIDEVRAGSIVTDDGVERDVDAILFGTGFKVTDQPLAHLVVGREGKTLHEWWNGSPRAYLGTTVHGFPNFFLLQGPNTGLGHTSVILMIEAQIEHLLVAMDRMKARRATVIEPRAEAEAAFVADVDRKMRGSVWTAGGCASWYLDKTGRNSTLWPGHTFTFARLVRRFDEAAYLFRAETISASEWRDGARDRSLGSSPCSKTRAASGAA